MKIELWKWNFFGVKEFFSWILILKIAVKMNLRIITKNHTADPEIGFLTKWISKSYGRATAMPTVWLFSSENFISYMLRQLVEKWRNKSRDVGFSYWVYRPLPVEFPYSIISSMISFGITLLIYHDARKFSRNLNVGGFPGDISECQFLSFFVKNFVLVMINHDLNVNL